MSILTIKDDLDLVIEYSPTIIETSLELHLNKHKNGLSIAKYYPEYRMKEGETQVFSFARDTINDIHGYRLTYQKVFSTDTHKKSLNCLINHFNDRKAYSECISVYNEDEEGIHIDLYSEHTGILEHYSKLKSMPLKNIMKGFYEVLRCEKMTPENIEKIKSIDELYREVLRSSENQGKSFFFEWDDESFSGNIRHLIGILYSQKYLIKEKHLEPER